MTQSRQHRSDLYRLATLALEHYALASPRLTLLTAKEHALFRVDAGRPPQAVPERFGLRLYRPEAYQAASVASEIEWLSALCRTTSLVVPEPVPTRAGDHLLQIRDSDASPSDRAVALFRWVDGRRRRKSLTPSALAAVGRFVGQLHNHAMGFVPRVGATAQHWDWERVFGGNSAVGPGGDHPLLTSEHRQMLAAIATSVRAAMAQLGTSKDVWGLIHADLHSANYLFRGTEVRAIDFEDCGWGYYLYDLAVILDELDAAFPAAAPALRQGLLDGYREVRALADEHAALLDVFVAMRLAELIRWHAMSDEPAHHAAVPTLLDETLRHQRRLDAGSG